MNTEIYILFFNQGINIKTTSEFENKNIKLVQVLNGLDRKESCACCLV